MLRDMCLYVVGGRKEFRNPRALRRAVWVKRHCPAGHAAAGCARHAGKTRSPSPRMACLPVWPVLRVSWKTVVVGERDHHHPGWSAYLCGLSLG